MRSAIRKKLLLRPERDFAHRIAGVLLGVAALAMARLLDEVEFLGFELKGTRATSRAGAIYRGAVL